jgi:N-methylhydantoinase B
MESTVRARGSQDEIDPIALEIITEGLVSIVREMRQAVLRTAHSPVISEAQDFSCALFTSAGEMAAQSRDMPGHVVAMPASVAEAMKDFGSSLKPGDVIILNDPYRGGSHLNDVTVVCPVFIDGRLFVFPCVRMHWADIGGMTPGSISGAATEILQEGVRIPPIKLIDQGVENRAAATLLFANVRSPDQRRGDLDACLAACRTAERRLHEFAGRYGVTEIERYLQATLNRTEARLRGAIGALEDGTYRYEDSLDLFTDGRYDPVLVRCALTVAGDELTADFTGSSPQVSAVVNASSAMTRAGVFIALKSMLDPGGLINGGAFRPIHVTVPPASIVNVDWPAPANAHSEVRKRVLSAVVGALAQVAPQAVTADQCGSTFQNLLGGLDSDGKSYLYYDYPPGGNGGFPEADGPDAMNPVDLGDISTVQPVEVLEAVSPVLVEFCAYRVDSCGDGMRRGGLGAARGTRLLAPSGSYSVQSDRAVVPPYGLGLGHAASPIRTSIRRGAEVIDFATPGKVAGQAVRTGDILVMESAGGGGWGDPLEREPERVMNDLEAGLITPERAASVYGIVRKADGDVDAMGTAERRSILRAERRMLIAAVLPDAAGFAGTRGRHRRAEMSRATARALGVEPGGLIELHGAHPAPLRAWVYPSSAFPDGTVAVTAEGLTIIGIGAGERLLVRSLPTKLRVFNEEGEKS